MALRKNFAAFLTMLLLATAGCDAGSGIAPSATPLSPSAAETEPRTKTDANRATGTVSGTGLAEFNGAQAGSTILSHAGNGRAVIGPAGGTVELAGVGWVRFLPDTFSRPTSVTLSRTQDTDIAHIYSWMADELGVRARTPYELRVVLGGEQPAVPVRVSLTVPREIQARAGSGDEVRIMHLHVYDDPGVERFEHLSVSSERGKPSDDHVASWEGDINFQPGPDGNMQGWFLLGLTWPNRSRPASK